MCGPLVIPMISMAIAAASAIAQDQGARADAKSNLKYQEAQMRANNEAAMQNAGAAVKEQTEQEAAENIQQMQNMQAAAAEKQKNQIDALQKQGAAMASSPYGNGASFDALMADYGRALAVNQDTVDHQLEMQGIAAETNKRSYRDKAHYRINSQQGYIPAPVSGPNTLASALGIAGSAMSAYNSATNYGRTPLGSTAAPTKP